MQERNAVKVDVWLNAQCIQPTFLYGTLIAHLYYLSLLSTCMPLHPLVMAFPRTVIPQHHMEKADFVQISLCFVFSTEINVNFSPISTQFRETIIVPCFCKLRKQEEEGSPRCLTLVMRKFNFERDFDISFKSLYEVCEIE